MIEELANLPQGTDGSLQQFVQRSQVQTYANVERLRKIMEEDLKMTRTGRVPGFAGNGELARNLSLVGQMINANHQYPDGVVLFLGAMAAPTEDRGVKGAGFTHKVGDIVTVASPPLGRLVNRMKTSDTCPPWNFGVRDLMRSLARRGIV